MEKEKCCCGECCDELCYDNTVPKIDKPAPNFITEAYHEDDTKKLV